MSFRSSSTGVSGPGGTSAHSGASFPRPLYFWLGAMVATVGILMQLPMVFMQHDMDTQMNMVMPLSMNTQMNIGMALDAIGLVIAGYGLFAGRRTAPPPPGVRYTVRTRPDVKITTVHRKLIAFLSLGMIIDVMKPTTIAFIEPGMRVEYHISTSTVAWMPVAALTGTVIGSIVWGLFADRLGRRAVILLATLMFVSTTVCGAMPTFGGNITMCFFMGVAAGGMLPIAYALMAETLPPRQRGWIMVLQAGLATTVAFLVTSGLAALMLPLFGWRIMWFCHLPLALLMLVFNRWVPESPRFLIEHGRAEDAKQVMDKLGLMLVPETAAAARSAHHTGNAAAVLFGPAYRSRTLVILVYALSWGMIYWGFMTFLPALLKSSTLGSSEVLFLSSVLAVPGTALVAYCYSAWSTRKTMALYGGVTVSALVLISITNLTTSGTLVSIVLLVLLITGTSGIIAVLSPYTAEVYPTSHRGAGSGLAAACTKVGGMFGPPLMALLLTFVPGARLIALVAAVPMGLATIAIARRGMETHGRDLEELQPEEPPVDIVDAARTSKPVPAAGD